MRCSRMFAEKSLRTAFLLLQVFDVLVDLTQLDVVPTAISQVRRRHLDHF